MVAVAVVVLISIAAAVAVAAAVVVVVLVVVKVVVVVLIVVAVIYSNVRLMDIGGNIRISTEPSIFGISTSVQWNFIVICIQCRSIPWKTGVGWVGVGGAQSNFPTGDHQKIFNLILIWSYYLYFWENIYIYIFFFFFFFFWGGGHRPPAHGMILKIRQVVHSRKGLKLTWKTFPRLILHMAVKVGKKMKLER